MRYFVVFSYIGTDFHGSQTQPNGITVQETMESAFATILRTPIALTFAGRTDAGVHARQMVAHFDLPSPITDHRSPFTVHRSPITVHRSPITDRLNSLLPASIAIQEIYPVSDDMHARFSATARTYEYHITEVKNPFLQGLAAQVAPGLDYDAMNEAAATLLGTQDFASFCKVHTDVKTTFCTITEAHWERVGEHEAVFTITANRFLRNMVRAVVGTLMDVGRGKMSVEDFRRVIADHNRCRAGQSAPAEGLYLTKVVYNE